MRSTVESWRIYSNGYDLKNPFRPDFALCPPPHAPIVFRNRADADRGDACSARGIDRPKHHGGDVHRKALADAQIGEAAREPILHRNAAAMLGRAAGVEQREIAAASYGRAGLWVGATP
jgi:hypothetical protein